jgi:hypothetical protein
MFLQQPTPCSIGLSATSQQYFSLKTNQPPATSHQYLSLRTNQHQPSVTSKTNRLLIFSFCQLQGLKTAENGPRRANTNLHVTDMCEPDHMFVDHTGIVTSLTKYTIVF